MKRIVMLAVALVIGGVALVASATTAPALTNGDSSAAKSTWGCAGGFDVGLGVCVNDPLPPRPPIVDIPRPGAV
jgi:hypothetical protein